VLHAAGGVRSCSYIPLVAEWPDVTDHPDPATLDQIGRLQKLASEVTEPTLKMQLTLALDAVVERVSPQLPADFEFLRDATDDLPYGIVPDVTGRAAATGWEILREAGYVVKPPKISVTTDPDQDGIIADQNPLGGTQHDPPETVTIWMGVLEQNTSDTSKFPPGE
jgi:PASTA domain